VRLGDDCLVFFEVWGFWWFMIAHVFDDTVSRFHVSTFSLFLFFLLGSFGSVLFLLVFRSTLDTHLDQLRDTHMLPGRLSLLDYWTWLLYFVVLYVFSSLPSLDGRW
jgi:hypothetical protein